MYVIEKNKIKFSHQFNEPITRSLAEIIRNNNVTEVIFGWDFNQQVENLPTGIKTIIFCSYYFDLPLNNIPFTVETLKLSKFFDQPLDNLPDSLQTIYFGEHYNQILEYFPKNLRNIFFPITGHFNQKFIEYPDNLEVLVLPRNYNKKLEDLPKTLKKLCVHISYPYYHMLKMSVHKKDILDQYIL